MLCYGMLCYAMLCYAMLCYARSSLPFQLRPIGFGGKSSFMASQDHHLVRHSVIAALRHRDWPRAAPILLTWFLQLGCCTGLAMLFSVYGCKLTTDSPTVDSRDVFMAWVISIIQRFVLLEPFLITLATVLPVLVQDSKVMSVVFPCCVEQLNSGLGTCISCLNWFLR